MCSLFVALLLYLILVFLAFEEVALQDTLERELKPDVAVSGGRRVSVTGAIAYLPCLFCC